MHYEKDYLVMETTKIVNAGEEILNTYGPLDTPSALRRYGYITPQYATNDIVVIKATLLAEEAKKCYGIDQKHIDGWVSCHDNLSARAHSYRFDHSLKQMKQTILKLCMRIWTSSLSLSKQIIWMLKALENLTSRVSFQKL
jgi:hypothetical protein